VPQKLENVECNVYYMPHLCLNGAERNIIYIKIAPVNFDIVTPIELLTPL